MGYSSDGYPLVRLTYSPRHVYVWPNEDGWECKADRLMELSPPGADLVPECKDREYVTHYVQDENGDPVPLCTVHLEDLRVMGLVELTDTPYEEQ